MAVVDKRRQCGYEDGEQDLETSSAVEWKMMLSFFSRRALIMALARTLMPLRTSGVSLKYSASSG